MTTYAQVSSDRHTHTQIKQQLVIGYFRVFAFMCVYVHLWEDFCHGRPWADMGVGVLPVEGRGEGGGGGYGTPSQRGIGGRVCQCC